MCGCKKVVKKTECSRLKAMHLAKRNFVYIVINKVYVFREIPKGKNPIQVLKNDDRFINDSGELEFYYTSESPCLKK